MLVITNYQRNANPNYNKVPLHQSKRPSLKSLQDFPSGPVVKSLLVNAGDMRSILGLGRIPHATEQLSTFVQTTETHMLQSSCATTTDPTHPRAHAPHKRSHCNEEPVHCNQRKAPRTRKTQKKKSMNKCWRCVWRNANPPTLLVGI